MTDTTTVGQAATNATAAIANIPMSDVKQVLVFFGACLVATVAIWFMYLVKDAIKDEIETAKRNKHAKIHSNN